MIIVSQDKERIVNFDKIEILGIDIDNKLQIACDFNEGSMVLGTYSTEERVKEVLKEIWRFYEIAKRHESSGNDGRTVYLEDRFVYQIPEE